MSANLPVGALDVIFTCDICQASISDIYGDGGPGVAQTDFRDGRPHTADRRVTCLWLTQCMHLTCGAHLEGGGAPFHPMDESPKAPCPCCLTNEGDARPKALYAVRGLRKGSYDDAIPSILFETPPVDLRSEDIKMEALKFQYLSLIRYGTSMFTKYRDMELATRKAGAVLKTVTAEHSALDKENKELKAKLASLKDAHADVAKWKERVPKLTHYLKQWPSVMQEVNGLRGQLSQLGYSVPKKDYTYRLEADIGNETPVRMRGGAHTRNKGVRTSRVPTDNTQSEYATAQTHVSGSSSGRKRKLSEFASQSAALDYGQQKHDHNQRDPIAEARDRIDTTTPAALTDHLRGGEVPGDSNTLPSDPAGTQNIQTCKDGAWKSCEQDVQQHRSSMIIPSHQDQCPTEKYAMSGAIPQPTPPVQPRTEEQLSRKSIPQHHEQHKDQPQQQGGNYQQENMYHMYDKRPSGLLIAEPLQTNNRRILEAQLQSSRNQLSMARLPTRGNEAGYVASRQSYPQPRHQSDRSPNFNYVPVTPLSRRHHAPRSSQVLNQNLSPFFTRCQGGVRSGLSPVLAGISANARVGTVSKETKPLPSHRQPDWTHPRSLNGLSFITVPRGQNRNEPLLHANNVGAPRNLIINDPFNPHNAQHTNNNYIKRPNQSRLSSSYLNSMVSQPAMQAPKLYTTPRMPPISNFAPAPPSRRIFTRNDALNTVNIPRTHGATSFYQNQERSMDPSRLQNGLAMDSRDLFSAAGGRRSVRR